MTDSIKSINLNTTNIQNPNVSEEQVSNKEAQKEEQKAAPQVEIKEVSPEKIQTFFNVMASYVIGGMNVNKAKDVNVPRTAEFYLSKLSPELRSELEASIGAMMEEFEPSVVAFAKKFEEELGDKFINLPEDEQLALAAQGLINNDEE
ncbi:MAG: hypothetical protein MJ180_05570 [Candidatus Gastranaerophilales bacterium]|nr:hypothetical protein [Candidatus Gastranaerophilales bacterium]